MKILNFYILFLILIASAQAQTTLNQLFLNANELFNNQKYFDAITEYKRVQYFDTENHFSYETNFRIGECYKAGLKLDDAIFYFGKALSYADNEEKRYNITVEIIKSNILRRTFTNAYSLIAAAKKTFNQEGKKQELNYWLGWAYMLDKKWEAAAKLFKKLEQDELTNLCNNVIDEEYPVTFTKLISYIVPGAGQIYTGYYLSGLMSLGWNILWGYITFDAFMAERVFDGVVVANLLWFRFYRGNYQNAEKFAVEKNVKIYNNAYNYLMEKYKGKKP